MGDRNFVVQHCWTLRSVLAMMFVRILRLNLDSCWFVAYSGKEREKIGVARLTHTFPAIDPLAEQGGYWQVGVEQDQLESLLKSNDRVRLARLLMAKEVCENPTVIFEDWMRPEQNDGLCYCGKPEHDQRGPRIETPPPPNMVFCVYVKRSGKVTDWRWESCDADNPDYPALWNKKTLDKCRFGRIVWPKIETIS